MPDALSTSRPYRKRQPNLNHIPLRLGKHFSVKRNGQHEHHEDRDCASNGPTAATRLVARRLRGCVVTPVLDGFRPIANHHQTALHHSAPTQTTTSTTTTSALRGARATSSTTDTTGATTTTSATTASETDDANATPDPTATGSLRPGEDQLIPGALDDTSDLRRTNLRGTPIDERLPRRAEETQTPGIPVGTFTLRPSLSQSLGTEQTRSGATRERRTYMETGLKGVLTSDWSRHQLSITGEGKWQKNLSGDSATKPSASIKGELRLDLSRDTIARITPDTISAARILTIPTPSVAPSSNPAFTAFRAAWRWSGISASCAVRSPSMQSATSIRTCS